MTEYKIIRKSHYGTFFIDDYTFTNQKDADAFLNAVIKNSDRGGSKYWVVEIDEAKCKYIPTEKELSDYQSDSDTEGDVTEYTNVGSSN